jgi:hypothetical protein
MTSTRNPQTPKSAVTPLADALEVAAPVGCPSRGAASAFRPAISADDPTVAADLGQVIA